MKANEFVKQHGFDGAYELWEGSFNLFENDLCILKGVEVISVEELLRELNEHDPDFYFKTLLSRNNVIK